MEYYYALRCIVWNSLVDVWTIESVQTAYLAFWKKDISLRLKWHIHDCLVDEKGLFIFKNFFWHRELQHKLKDVHINMINMYKHNNSLYLEREV